MEKQGHLEIQIKGFKGNQELKPDNYDIREVIQILESSENLLFPAEKKDRPVISYQIAEGSVRHIMSTSLQAIIGFNAVLGEINQNRSLDFLQANTIHAIESLQEAAKKKNFRFTLKTSVAKSNELVIDKNTLFMRTESLWGDAEFYFYGKITNMGGKDKANIHLVTEGNGTLIIQTPQSVLEAIESNPLYKFYGIRAAGKQNIETGELDERTLRFLELINYSQIYDQDYLKKLRDKATSRWLTNIDPDKWLKQIRGGYDG